MKSIPTIWRRKLWQQKSDSPEQVFKTLVARGERSGAVMAVIPGDQELDLKALASAAGERKIQLVPVKELQALTGYIRGGVTALAAKREFPVFVDETIELCDTVSVFGGSARASDPDLAQRLHSRGAGYDRPSGAAEKILTQPGFSSEDARSPQGTQASTEEFPVNPVSAVVNRRLSHQKPCSTKSSMVRALCCDSRCIIFSTYLAMRSASRFTGSPGLSEFRLVISTVCGMMAMVQRL